VFEGHTDLVRTVSVNVPDGLLVSGSYDRTIRVSQPCFAVRNLIWSAASVAGVGWANADASQMWDLHTGELVRKLKSTHTSLVFDVQLSTTRLVSYVPSFGTANGKGIGLIGRTSHDNSVQVLTFGTGLPYLGLFA
jgi:WD40 repeat protein